MPTPYEPHAVTRLRERFGLEVTERQFRRLAALLSDPDARRQDPRFRLLERRDRGIEVWLTRLEREAAPPIWAKAVFDSRRQVIVTFYPCVERRVLPGTRAGIYARSLVETHA